MTQSEDWDDPEPCPYPVAEPAASLYLDVSAVKATIQISHINSKQTSTDYNFSFIQY